jgi:hypothetical protein
MPLLQRLLEQANHRFGSEQIAAIDPDALAPRELTVHLLADCAEAVGIKLTTEEREFVNRTPIAIQEAIRGVSYSAVVRSRASKESNQPLAKIPITFAWMAQYDYELHVTEARSTRSSWGGITVIIRGPYPA